MLLGVEPLGVGSVGLALMILAALVSFAVGAKRHRRNALLRQVDVDELMRQRLEATARIVLILEKDEFANQASPTEQVRQREHRSDRSLPGAIT